MDNRLIETEVKIYTPDLSTVVARIIAVGASLVSERVYERNIRYENTGETLTASGIVVRLRQDTRARLTYKAPYEGGPEGVTTRFEAEVTVDNFDTMDVILQRLGYHPHVVYEKYRTTYGLGEVEITLDEMPYGNFIEIEGPAPAIEATLNRLGLQKEPRFLESYMVLFDRVKEALALAVHDLTFENFQGVIVPPDVFYGHH
jgi:adenylate cyclase class 2